MCHGSFPLVPSGYICDAGRMRSPWILGGALLATISVPGEARACSFNCLDPSIYPSEGVELPRNAAVRILGSYSDPAVSVTVDGTMAIFVEDPALSGTDAPFALCYSGTAIRVKPAPAVGTTVTFDVAGTPNRSYAYLIGAPDVTRPAPLMDVSVDVHDYPSEDSCSTCDFGYGINLWVNISGGLQDDGSAIVHNIYFNDKEDGADGWLARTVEATAKHVAVPLLSSWTDEHDPISGFCVTVRTFDLAGNQASHAHRVCSACRARIEPGEQTICDEVVTAMPEWTEADVVMGGQCSSTKFPSDEQPQPPPPPSPEEGSTGSDTSVETPGASEEVSVERGCGCDGTGGAWSWACGFLLVRRRRTRAQ